mmetsp:Transcript_51437/g.76309  ORF Transcript_51437/g.76309 Transcript_51437/m.76309 type:complete len:190 (+) Transcript_51437:141-710(+)
MNDSERINTTTGTIVEESKAVGPYLWAIVFVLAVAYYIKNHVYARKSKTKTGGGTMTAESVRMARIRQLEQLKTSSAANQQQKETTNSNKPRTSSIAAMVAENAAAKKEYEIRTAAAQKKEKARKMYLRRKMEEEAEEEKRRKMEEFGPGWQRHEEGNGALGYNAMDPGASSGSGGYKAVKKSVRRGGG